MYSSIEEMKTFIRLYDSKAGFQKFRQLLNLSRNDIKYHIKYLNEYRNLIIYREPNKSLPSETDSENSVSVQNTDREDIFDSVITDIDVARKFVSLVDEKSTAKRLGRLGIPANRIKEYTAKTELYREFINKKDAEAVEEVESLYSLEPQSFPELPQSGIDIQKPVYQPPYYVAHHHLDVSDETGNQRKLEPNGISIIMPTFNRIKNLRRSIFSILAQEQIPVNIQLIIINDGSTDGTKEYLDSLCFPSWITPEIYHMDKKQLWTSPSISYNFAFSKVLYNYVVHYGVDMILLDKDCLRSIYKHMDIDRYVYLMQSKLPEESIELVTMNGDFFLLANIYSKPTISTAFPFIAATSLDALQRIGFYSMGYGPGPGEDDELLEKIEAIKCKFTRIIDHAASHQEHPRGCSGVDNKLIRDAGCKLLAERIKVGTVKQY